MKIVVGSTAAGHKGGEASRWLAHAAGMKACTPHELRFFLAAEMQPSGLEPRLESVSAQVKALGGEVWTYMIDDGSEAVNNENRMVRICEGRNLIIEYAIRQKAEWVLFVDADIVIPPDVINKLLEMGHKFCGFKVPSYCLSGRPIQDYDFPVQEYQNTAGAWFLHRSVFRFFRWLWDPDDGLTDDPATYRIIRDHLGLLQHNRLDVTGEHASLVQFHLRKGDTHIQRPALWGHPITVVLPVYFVADSHVEMTRRVLEKLLPEHVAKIYVMSNGGVGRPRARGMDMLGRASEESHGKIIICTAEGNSIYEMWNLGWRQSLEDFGDEVLIAFLNNDIDFLPGTLEVLAKALVRNEVWVTYPDSSCDVGNGARLTGRTIATRGSKRHGGMTGHCFMIKGGIHTKAGFPLFDERYGCWYGDDDFAFRINQYGFEIHRIEGLPCNHLNEATVQYRPDVAARRDQDRSLFVGQWGDI